MGKLLLSKIFRILYSIIGTKSINPCISDIE